MKTRKEKIDVFERITTRVVKEHFAERNGDYSPTVHILYANDDKEESTQIKIFQLPAEIIDTERGKDILAEIIIPTIIKRFTSVSQNVISVGFVSDTYVTEFSMPAGEKEEYLKMSLNDIKKVPHTKREALSFVFYTHENTWSSHFPYDRIDGKVVFTGGQMGVDSVVAGGRFANLLKPKPNDN